MDDINPTPQDNRQASACWLVDSKRTRPDALVLLATITLPTVRVGPVMERTDLAPYCRPRPTGLRRPAMLYSDPCTKGPAYRPDNLRRNRLPTLLPIVAKDKRVRAHTDLREVVGSLYVGNLAPLESFTLPLTTCGRTFCVAASDVLCWRGLTVPQELSCIRDSPDGR